MPHYRTDIKQLTKNCRYYTSQKWASVEEKIQHLEERNYNFIIDPDFQRPHVWTREQQIAYVEFKLQGGHGSDQLYFNCAGFLSDYRGPYVLVDGKQRLHAVRCYLKDKFPAFGIKHSKWEGPLPDSCEFIWNVNDLNTRVEVLQWYIEMNSGGMAHTNEELNSVRKLIELEKA